MSHNSLKKEAGLDVIQLTQCEGWILAMHFTRFQLVYHNISAAVLVSLGNSIARAKKKQKAKIETHHPFY